jgi:anti-sigma factor RsiW
MSAHCRRILTQLDAHLDGTLDPAAAREVSMHLASCAACAAEAATAREIAEALGGFARVEVRVSIEDRVMARVRQAPRPAAPAVWTPRSGGILGGAALAGLFTEAAALVALALLLPPVRRTLGILVSALDRTLGASRVLAECLLATADVLLLLARAGSVVLQALGTALPSPIVLASMFLGTLTLMTFIVVGRDLRSPRLQSRGLR